MPIPRHRAARGVLVVAALLASLQFGGCASVTMPSSTASINNVEKLKATGAAPMSMGEFKASGQAIHADKGLSLRGINVVKPANGSFALQLRDQLAAELRASGLLADDGKVKIQGTLTENSLDPAMGTGTARLGARFVVLREGHAVFDKTLTALAQWESSLVGAIAVPAAINQYGTIYQTLIGKLLDDPDFKAAVTR